MIKALKGVYENKTIGNLIRNDDLTYSFKYAPHLAYRLASLCPEFSFASSGTPF